MPQFTYRALDTEKQLKTGSVEAPTRGDAIIKLRQQHLQPLAVSLQTEASDTAARPMENRGVSLSIGQQMLFFTTLQQTQAAGITLAASLDMLATQARGALRQLAQQMSEAIAKGESLSQQMDRFESRFTPPCPALMRAGDVSGKVPEMAAECNQWLATIVVARRQAITELIYPAIVLAFALFVPAILYIVLAYLGKSMVIDQTIFNGARSAFLISMLSGLGLLALAVIVIVLKRFSNTVPAIKIALDKIAWNTPIYSAMERSGAQSRFLRALGSLYHAGLPPAQCLEYASQSAGQMVIAQRVAPHVNTVRNGGTLAAALLASDTMPISVTSQMLVAETSGKIDESLIRLSAMLDDIHRNAVRRVVIIAGALGLLFAMALGSISILNMGIGLKNGYENQLNGIGP
ncbi:MAG: type II secretion system F family protein [Armatimonadota bacterium]